MFSSLNNWYIWKYDNDILGRQNEMGTKEYSTFFKFDGAVQDFKTELVSCAEKSLEVINTKPCIFFSGGIDSEIVIRSYLELGVNPEIIIVRYEDDINIYDVSFAVVICNQLGINYRIVDFNLKKFYENDAERVAEIAQIDRPRALPQLKFLEFTDNFPIYGSGDITVFRTDDDYTKKGKWMVCCHEHDTSWCKYSMAINRPAILCWFKWTPGVVLSYFRTEWCQKLINDEYIGKLGTNSTKYFGYKEAFPDIIPRIKKTGFETYSNDLITEYEIFLKNKFNGLKFRNLYKHELDIFNVV